MIQPAVAMFDDDGNAIEPSETEIVSGVNDQGERDGERLRRYHADVDGAFWQWNDVWLSAAFRAFDIRQDCQRIGAPVLAIQGEDDPYGTMAQIDEIALPPSQIERVTLASCGHSPHRDQTRAATERITHFLLNQA